MHQVSNVFRQLFMLSTKKANNHSLDIENVTALQIVFERSFQTAESLHPWTTDSLTEGLVCRLITTEPVSSRGQWWISITCGFSLRSEPLPVPSEQSHCWCQPKVRHVFLFSSPVFLLKLNTASVLVYFYVGLVITCSFLFFWQFTTSYFQSFHCCFS